MSAQLLDVRERIERSRVRVVPFTIEYLDDVLVGAHEIHDHSVYSNVPLDEKKLIQQLRAAGTNLNPSRYFRVAVRDGVAIGAFYGTLLRVFFADVLVAKDLGWWVRERYRGGYAAMALLFDFEKWSLSQGAVSVGIGQTGVENIDRTTKLFKHCGYRLVGYNAMKDLTHGC